MTKFHICGIHERAVVELLIQHEAKLSGVSDNKTSSQKVHVRTISHQRCACDNIERFVVIV